MSKYNPGDIVTIRGTEFVVLDVEEGTAKGSTDKLFVLLKEPVGSTAFSNDGNDYTESKLREAVDHWFGEFAADLNNELIFSREISLLTMDGHANHGTMHCSAAPLTFDEWRKYSCHIPDCEKRYWLATGDSAPGRYGTTGALLVLPNGGLYINFCSLSYAARPALVVSEELIDTPKDEGLRKYSTMELIQELAERVEENDVE